VLKKGSFHDGRNVIRVNEMSRIPREWVVRHPVLEAEVPSDSGVILGATELGELGSKGKKAPPGLTPLSTENRQFSCGEGFVFLLLFDIRLYAW